MSIARKATTRNAVICLIETTTSSFMREICTALPALRDQCGIASPLGCVTAAAAVYATNNATPPISRPIDLT
jgi:hypothetical protein